MLPVEEMLAAIMYPEANKLVEDTEEKVLCPAFACSDPPTVRFWVEETLPVGLMEKSKAPVDVAISKRFAVWLVTPRIWSVVVPADTPRIKTSAEEEAAVIMPSVELPLAWIRREEVAEPARLPNKT